MKRVLKRRPRLQKQLNIFRLFRIWLPFKTGCRLLYALFSFQFLHKLLVHKQNLQHSMMTYWTNKVLAKQWLHIIATLLKNEHCTFWQILKFISEHLDLMLWFRLEFQAYKHTEHLGRTVRSLLCKPSPGQAPFSIWVINM